MEGASLGITSKFPNYFDIDDFFSAKEIDGKDFFSNIPFVFLLY
jgi:hypothetical protein